MNSEDLAIMIFLVTLSVVVGGVILLRPVMGRLGSLLEAIALEKRRAIEPSADRDDRLVTVVESIDRRIALLEERQDFTDRLLRSGNNVNAGARTADERIRETR
jgi:hypothetical protein